MKKIIYLFIAVITLSCAGNEKNLPNNFDFGKTESGIYTNDYFDLEIVFDSDWVVQNKEDMNDLMDASSKFASNNDESLKRIIEASKVNTAYLLTVFKYEVGSAVEFNPSFMALAENTERSPGIKDGNDYLFHAKKTLIMTKMPYTFDDEIYDKEIGKHTFYIMEARLDYLGQTIIQEYMTTVIKGFSLSFIISYTTEEEKGELYEILDKIEM